MYSDDVKPYLPVDAVLSDSQLENTPQLIDRARNSYRALRFACFIHEIVIDPYGDWPH